MTWRWWYWIVLGMVVLSIITWTIMIATMTNELPRRQALVVSVVPTEVIHGQTILVKMSLQPDPRCELVLSWRLRDSEGTIVLSDEARTYPEHEDTVLPISKEYIVSTAAAPGRGVMERRLQWTCNKVQAVTRPGIDLEPVYIGILLP